MTCRNPFACLAVASMVLWLGLAPAAQALTPDQVLALKKAGVSEETIQMMIRQEEAAKSGTANPLDRREVKDGQGNTVVVYSIGPAPRAGGEDPEQKKLDRAWRMLQNLIIDQRSTAQ